MTARATAPRSGRASRRTTETDVEISVVIERDAAFTAATGVGFLDHLLTTLARHGGFGGSIRTDGDLHVDDHHTAEDTALVLGSALDDALGDRAGVRRFGSAYAPLDESLARAVVDLSGRPFAVISLGLERPSIGALATENVAHFIRSLATTLRATVHVDVLRGENDHHRAEAAFKALALALREAMSRGLTDSPSTNSPSKSSIPSTKETLR